MRKLAIFVEGYTEVLFVEKLIESVAGAHNVLIQSERIRGGRRVPRTRTTIKAARAATNENYYVLIVDCEGDHQVAERIREEHKNLTNAGFERLIGLRDVRPKFTHQDIPKLRVSLLKYVDQTLAPVHFILAIMEIEAWFLSEHNHFPLVEPRITVPAIIASLGFDPSTQDMTARFEPREDMDAAYAIGGVLYEKPAEQTTEVLDYGAVYLQLPARIPDLQDLLGILDGFLTAQPAIAGAAAA